MPPMISEECDLDRFIEAIVDLPYHEVLVSTLNEGYATTDLLAHKRRDIAPDEEISQILEYNKALNDFIFLLQTGMKPDYVTKKDVKNYNKFCRVAQSLVEKEELLPTILKFFDD